MNKGNGNSQPTYNPTTQPRYYLGYSFPPHFNLTFALLPTGDYMQIRNLDRI